MARDRAESPFSAAKQVCLRCALHHVLKHWGQTATAVTLLSAATLVNAQAAITAITGQQVNGRDAVRVEFNGATDVVPTSFKMDSPPRIAIDLPGIEAGTIARSVPLAQGNIKSIRLAAAGDRTRLVMELAEAAELRTSRDGNALVLTLEPSARTAAPKGDTVVWRKPTPAPLAKPRRCVSGPLPTPHPNPPLPRQLPRAATSHWTLPTPRSTRWPAPWPPSPAATWWSIRASKAR